MEILVVFGSISDHVVHEKIASHLSSDHSITSRVISAHRHPDKLEKELKNHPYDLVIAGAGLAAHLPGVIASKTLTPTIGVSINSQLGGLDALLSILQMPYGVPVLFFSEERCLEIKAFIDGAKTIDLSSGIHVVTHGEDLDKQPYKKEKNRLCELSDKVNIPISFGNLAEEKKPLIVWVRDENDFLSPNISAIYVPVFPHDIVNQSSVVRKLKQLVNSRGGFVGCNNSRNAFLLWIQWFGSGSPLFSEKLWIIRRGFYEKSSL